MLTKETSAGFSPAFEYPTYKYEKEEGGRTLGKASTTGSRIVPTPEGYTEVIEYQDVNDDFQDYVESVIKEHADLTDDKLAEAPPFIGHGRNSRWLDARELRREAKK